MSIYNALERPITGRESFMSRLTLPLVALVAAGTALSGCAKDRNLPTELAPSRMTSIGVNAYLWRAAVDTLSFAPLITADSNGGVIVTDWYASPNSPGERVKLTVSIIDQDLRADALRVAASRQINQSGVWVDAPVAAATVQKLEDIILTRARDLRRTTVGG